MHADAMLRRAIVALAVATALILIPGATEAQRRPLSPRPFPTAGEPESASTAREDAGTSAVTTPGQSAQRALAAAAAMADREAPTEEELGMPIFPNSQYITSYDAGRGQHFHLFGSTATFVDLVGYYSVVLDERGRRVYNRPAIHQFETGPFRDREMDYRPSVTIKDYSLNGSPSYLNTAPGGDPPAFSTIIQITTTLPAGAAATR